VGDEVGTTAVDGVMPEIARPPVRRRSGATRVLELVARGWRGAMVLSRLVSGLALIAGGVVWAIARGISFYGLSPAGMYDSIAQPPLLLVLVGVWLLYRSRRR
jgi:hypothetical protein